MKLQKILHKIDYQIIKGNLDIDIKDISYDSRMVTEGSAFVALIGIDTDGHNYIEAAIKRGATCIFICKDMDIKEDITVIKLKDTRKELANLSANLFENPSDKLIKIAITGTKGKTSTSWMIKNILEHAGYKVGVIGTLGTYIDGSLHSHKNTTPESYMIQKFMRQMVDCGCQYLIMETSSQALKVGRVNNIYYEYGIFTNLSLDHIGPREHPTYEDYVYSKAQLFKQCKIGILNQDEREYPSMVKDATCKIYTYGEKNSDLEIQKIHSLHTNHFLGTEFTTIGLLNDTFQVSSPGAFSAYNASAAILLCNLLGIQEKFIQIGLQQFSVRGRCEIFSIQDKFKVVIDFAHNHISMESILKTMREYHPHKIITIFGCGGGRSRELRCDLGMVAGTYSDFSIITTDNPRNDEIDEINADIAKGVESVGGTYLIIRNRKDAILYALNHAEENDIILLLGKGHETYQEIKGMKYPFDEKKIITEFQFSKER